MKKNIKELREKYISNPPEGMTSEDIRHMSEQILKVPGTLRNLWYCV